MTSDRTIDLHVLLESKKQEARELSHSGQYNHAAIAWEAVEEIQKRIDSGDDYQINF